MFTVAHRSHAAAAKDTQPNEEVVVESETNSPYFEADALMGADVRDGSVLVVWVWKSACVDVDGLFRHLLLE